MLAGPTHRVVYGGLVAIALTWAVGCSSTDTADTSTADDRPNAPTPTADVDTSTEEDRSEAPAPTADFERLEDEFDVRLGVYALDTGTGKEITHNPDDRFAYASTFKPFACAVMIEPLDMAELDETVVEYEAEDVFGHSPITEENVDSGLTLREVCDAAIRYSDNTAANLLFDQVGGPEGLQEALRGIGDETTHVDRVEPDLAEGVPGDTRDTSTPRQWAANLQEYLYGDTLDEEKQDLLAEMLRENTTGDNLIRAGVPGDWKVGDKTGNGGYGTRNDIGVLWPPDEEPIIIAVMSSRDIEDAEHDDALIAETAAVVADAIHQP